ncbi:MAG: diguanylate cyclase [Oscillospiraceae bacterium]|nr:diguanylate cyclase [Oscillospiraceae bacterium]
MNGILLIASKPSIKDTFTAMLSPAFQVALADSEEEGLRILNDRHDEFVAVLIELALARQSGFAFANHMQGSSYFSLIPMIAISDELPVPEDMDCIEHGFFDLLTAYAPQPLVYKRINNAIRAKDSLSLSEVEKMLKELPSCIFLKDTEGKYVFSTQYWAHLNTSGDPNWTIRGKTDLEIRKDRLNALKAMDADRKILQTGVGTDYIIEENTAGKQEFLQLIKRPVYDQDGKISGIIALINDVTDHQLLKRELEKRAKTDTLTGLLNKSASEDLIRMMVSNYRQDDEYSALLIIDVDHFKRVNDTFGHAEGDRVLAEIGRIIKNCCRAADVAGRIGGDEFVIFMRHIEDPENACRLAERLQEKVARAFADDRLKRHVSLSIGIAICPVNGKDYDTLFRSADGALYYVKKHGRASYRTCPAQNPDAEPAHD